MKQVSRLFLGLTFLYTLLICALGSWWLYLIIQYGGKLETLLGNEDKGKVISMVKWEGLTFFALLLLLTASLLFLYLKDLKKTKSLQAFFASMTHELKTPLASVKLQGEVISDSIERIDYQLLAKDRSYQDKLKNNHLKLSQRLVEDANKLETTMDKILQLSRLEGGGNLHLGKVELDKVFEEVISGYGKSIEVHADWQHSKEILADEFAVTLILKNFIENTLHHSESKKIWIETQDTLEGVKFIYEDKGHFKGDPQKLGTLFYKHNSKKGSGIGLYLTKVLMNKMQGKWSFQIGEGMRFILDFKSRSLS